VEEALRLELAKFGLNITSASLLAEETIFEAPASIIDSVAFAFLEIGYLSYTGKGCEFRNVSIGRYCSIAANALVGPGEHQMSWLGTHPIFEEWAGRGVAPHPRTRIGNDVWIGEGALLSRGVRVADGAIVAARSVVTKDVGPYEVVAGIPARVVRRRFSDDIVDRLLRLGWWQYDLSEIRHRLDFSEASQCVDLLEAALTGGELRPLVTRKYKATRTDSQLIVGEMAST
jgi:virginiamycin A acetyltransferase